MGDINRCAHCSRPVFDGGRFCDSLCELAHDGGVSLRGRVIGSALLRRIRRHWTGTGLP